jgi:mannose-1-phosphate guanylyltransferase
MYTNGTHAPLRCGIILAGGEGKRLRSFVRRVYGSTLPKQYINLLGTGSMLENTFHRAEKLVDPKQLLTVVCKEHLRHPEVRRQLVSRPTDTIVVQPKNKETAPGLLLPLIHLRHRYPESTVVAFPSDHFILEENSFMAHVHLGFRLVESEPSRMVLIGIEPSKPESDYGYILPGKKLAESLFADAQEISGFVEKPDSNTAQELIRRGGLWNTMVMIFNPKALLDVIRQQAWDLYRSFERIAAAMGTPFLMKVAEDVYREIEPANFSKVILEPLSRQQASRLIVLPVRNVHWSDWGSKQRIFSTLMQAADWGELRSSALAKL